MNILKKAAIAIAATSVVLAPVAASAAQSVGAARAVSSVDGQSELEGSTTWIVLALAAVAVVVGVVVLSDDDSPTSP